MKKNLIVTGGIFHPFEETSNSLSNILSEKFDSFFKINSFKIFFISSSLL